MKKTIEGGSGGAAGTTFAPLTSPVSDFCVRAAADRVDCTVDVAGNANVRFVLKIQVPASTGTDGIAPLGAPLSVHPTIPVTPMTATTIARSAIAQKRRRPRAR